MFQWKGHVLSPKSVRFSRTQTLDGWYFGGNSRQNNLVATEIWVARASGSHPVQNAKFSGGAKDEIWFQATPDVSMRSIFSVPAFSLHNYLIVLAQLLFR